MATSSIFKTVSIKTPNAAASLVHAMEQSQAASADIPPRPATMEPATREEVRQMFAPMNDL